MRENASPKDNGTLSKVLRGYYEDKITRIPQPVCGDTKDDRKGKYKKGATRPALERQRIRSWIISVSPDP